MLSTTGFGRATQVRLSQGADHRPQGRVGCRCGESSAAVDQSESGEAQLPYDSALSGFDAGRPILIESIEYTLWVRELGRLIRVYEGLSLVPEHRRYGPAILAAFKVPRVSGQPLNLPSAPEPVTITELRELPLSVLESMATTPDQIMPLTGGADGLAQLSPYDFIGEEYRSARQR